MPNQFTGPTVKNRIIRELLLEFPNSSKANLGKIAFERHPHLFDNPETARTMIRTITGAMGGKNRKKTRNIMEHKPQLPPSNCKEREFQVLPKECSNILWLSDVHIPNQDNEAIELAVEYGKKHDVNCIVLGGDILDNTPFTSHDAPPPGLDDVRTWFQYARQFIEYLKFQFPKAKLYWIEGNHDSWIKRYLMKKAPILFSDEYYHLPQRMKLDELGVKFFAEHVVLMAGKLQMHHGHTMIRGVFAPVNAARGLFLRVKSNAIIGHVHTTSHHVEKTLKGETIGTWSVGCLCTLAPDYDPHGTKHNLGFAHILVEKNGDFKVNNIAIHDGRII
jgi:predicted phosphodiesterase